ncbi:MAG: hydrogenase maturation nickel metallochaperone HypA [Acidobacteria bacterium]|nr:hydrogenase maturation nickel metallochaperone HypA [Acidobacteriota bacterium]
MHELSIVSALVEQVNNVAQAHGSTRVRHLTLQVGKMSNVVPELLQQAFEAFRKVEPLLKDARMEIRQVYPLMKCGRCSQEFVPDTFSSPCPRCLSTSVELIHGEELLLREVELEIQDGGQDG